MRINRDVVTPNDALAIATASTVPLLRGTLFGSWEPRRTAAGAVRTVLVDVIDLAELRYVLGQALGHICFGHTRMAFLIGGEKSALPAVLSWIASLRDLIFAGYWRSGIMSGDRAGILACGSVSKAIRAGQDFSGHQSIK